MAEVPLFDPQGNRAGTVPVDERDFGGRIRWDLLHQVVVAYEANRRQGTHATKTRARVSGGGRKPWRQKHTGRARQGSIRAPQWRKGGVVHGPRPREYRQRIPARMKRAALDSAILGKIRDGEILVIETLAFEKPKTKEMRRILGRMGVERSVLLGVESYDRNRWLSARNLPGVTMSEVRNLNAYDVLKARWLVLTRAALDLLVRARRTDARSAA